MDTMKFKADYAKSNRSKCKSCRSTIQNDSLRLAAMIQSRNVDKKVAHWYHFDCFWVKVKVSGHDYMHGFHSLREEDQHKIKEMIEEGDKAGADFKVEYAKTNRSICRSCRKKIEKKAVRISKKDCESTSAKRYGPKDAWYHIDCFARMKNDLEFNEDIATIAGFDSLEPDDQDELTKKVNGDKSATKRKAVTTPEAPTKKAKKLETGEEKLLREQNTNIWQCRDNLRKYVKTTVMRQVLKQNDQVAPRSINTLLDVMCDRLTFGALENCSECQDGKFVFTTNGYRCSGHITGWTYCTNFLKNPKRKPLKIPEEFLYVEILKNYKYKPKLRVYPVSQSIEWTPLHQMKFVIIAKTKKSKAVLTEEITNLGGTIASTIDGAVAACISTKTEVDKKSKNIKAAEKYDVHIVDEEFLEDLKPGEEVAARIRKHSLATWGSDPAKRIGVNTKMVLIQQNFSAGKFTSKLNLNGGAAVDPDSKLEDVAHVIEERGTIYYAVLGLVDSRTGYNSYYKIQVLEKKSRSGWYLFRSWGRVGTTIGGNTCNEVASREEAIDGFKDLFHKKTGNKWENCDNFVKKPKKFYPLEIDYGQEDDDVDLESARGGSKLPKSVQDVICAILDIKKMKKAMVEFEIDLKKMPLGKLSRHQIEEAYSILTELNGFIYTKRSRNKYHKLLDASNRFYTLIPHDFGMEKPPLLNTAEDIKTKAEMLDNLLDIEVAYRLLKSGDSGANPIDDQYNKLKCSIDPMDKSEDMYTRLLEFVNNTHAASHNEYSLEVEDIFEIKQDGEEEKFQPFEDLRNHQLLWHGSRTTNYAGILSQGLRIAPPEAPVSGYMFGKGVYFADMVSKSANYCHASKTDNIGYILLCEVALGNPHKLLSSSYITTLPAGKHSTKGCGMTVPDEEGAYFTEDDVKIPMGQATKAPIRSSLQYNEFIVYNTSQIKIKYMLKVIFTFNCHQRSEEEIDDEDEQV